MRLTIDVNFIDAWNEADHPRGQPENAGEFVSRGGGLPKKPISGPAGRVIATGRFHIVVLPNRDKSKYEARDRYEVSLVPKDAKGMPTYKASNSVGTIGFYDPNLAVLKTINADEPILMRQIPVPKEGLTDQIEPLPGKHMYRGMCAEEFADVQKTGRVRSLGELNLSGQEGLTYWSTNIREAQSYSASYVPGEFAPSFSRPAYVIASKPTQAFRVIYGTGNDEVGVTEAVSARDIVAIWRGDVYAFDPGSYVLFDEGNKLAEGSSSGVGARTVWTRVK